MLKFDRSTLLRRAAASTALTGVLLLLPQVASAQDLPTGGTVVGRGATIDTAMPGQVTINQTAERQIINWSSFNVAQGNTVVFNQPNASAATLNRVTGGTASMIAGRITATGSVYLVNPNGIAITATGNVQTGGGFIASTLDITDQNFTTGVNTFTGTGASAAVSNAGSITGNGFVALLGGTVSHSGTITVPTGRVALASGEQITLDLNGGNFLTVALPTNATTADGKALIEASGSITVQRALDGNNAIVIAAATAADAVRNAINLSGTLSVTRVLAAGDGGFITLSGGEGGTVTVSGSVTSRGEIGGGAAIDGDRVNLNDATFDFSSTFAGNPGGLLEVNASAITANGSLSSALDTTQSVNLYTLLTGTGDGAVRITAPLTSSGRGALLIRARTDIALAGISAPSLQVTLAAIGSANNGTVGSSGAMDVGLFNLTNGNWSQNAGTLPAFAARDFRFDRAEATFLRVAGGDGSTVTPYRIIDVYGLQGMASTGQLDRNFVLGNTIDASGTVNWNGGEGFVGIGSIVAPFAGKLSGADGSGGRYAIAGLSQNRSRTGGLFELLSGTVSDLSLTGVSIVSGTASGSFNAGALAGFLVAGGTVRNVDLAGSVTGSSNVGGLAGSNTTGTITDVTSSVIVVGTADNVGGLVGTTSGGTITRGVVTNDAIVQGRTGVGGLVGATTGRISVIDSSAASAVKGSGGLVGGLVGNLTGGSSVSGSRATGNVTSVNATVGGLIGRLTGVAGVQSGITNSFATGNVSGNSTVGGLVGQLAAGSGIVRITGSYATGTVTSTNTGGGFGTGGLVGILLAGSVIDSFATGAVSTNGNYTGGLIGDMQARASVSGSYATGDVTNNSNGTITSNALSTGGLVGRLDSSAANATSSIANSFATGIVTGSNNVGGLVGLQNATFGGAATIAGSYATGAVRATNAGIGGLVGQITVLGSTLGTLASITTSYATGAVSTTLAGNVATYVGGLVGYANRGSSNNTTISINNAYATGAVSSGGNNVGGLIGLTIYSTVNNVYATGTVRGVDSVGGLIGSLNTGSVLSNAYASGRVTGSVIVGGVMGSQASTATTSAIYWDSYSTGRGAAFGTGPGGGSNGIAVSSDPTVRSAYVPGSYAFAAATGIGTATPTGFVFLAGNGTRPFLAFEVPTAARAGMAGNASAVRTIRNSHELQLIGYNAETLSGNYRLAGGIDLSETGRVGSGIAGSTDRNNTAFGAVAANTPGAYSGMWAPTGFVALGTDGAGNVWNGSAFVAIGSITGTTYGYGGTFDGGGFALTGLTIARPTAAYTGLFGVTNGTVQNVSLTGSVTGAGTTGGLVGFLFRGGRVTGSSSAVSVTGGTNAGGLIGSTATGTTVRLSNASGTVSGASNVGGLIGYASGATVDRSFATGTASGTNYIGGLLGYSYLSTITDSYARGAAAASNTSAGGLIGKILGGSVARTYSTGAVSATTRAGGLIGAGDSAASVTSSYWDTQTSGQSVSGGGTGRTTAQMRDQTTYVGWDFINVWAPPGESLNTTPTLRPETFPLR